MSEHEVLDRVSRQVLSQKGYQPRGDRKLMLFDLSVRGHHPSYIQHLIRYWSVWNMQGSLDIVVSPKFLEEHGDVVASADDLDTVQFVAISKAEDDLLKSRKSRWKRALRNFQEWQILCKYAAMLGADHCLIMYFDTFQLPIVLSKTVGWTSPPEFSGIYFRPTFHYSRLANYQPSRQERWQQWRGKANFVPNSCAILS
ncbi:hypothetical protein HC928_15975 [bacterium]|nr:hypothetical protein [bacterium]